MEMVRYTSQDAQRYLELADQSGVLGALTSSGSSHFLVAGTYRESHLMASRLALYLGTINKEVELALYLRGKHGGKIHRQKAREEPAPYAQPRLKKLVVVDDTKTDEMLQHLRDACQGLRESNGIEEILYFARDLEGRLFTEFIPPRQTTESLDNPEAAQPR